jgi:hypothetical protein
VPAIGIFTRGIAAGGWLWTQLPFDVRRREGRSEVRLCSRLCSGNFAG